MTKEIIIDGCNVAECEHHYTNLVDGITYHGCSIYEQTNELGYQQDTICEQNPNCYFKQLQRLKQEKEELKYEIDRQKDTILYLQNYDICHKTLIEYKQALEEIREITKQERDCINSELTCCRLCEKLDLIKEKINEVFK